MDDHLISEQVIRSVLTMPEEEFIMLSVTKLARLFKMDRFKLSREFRQQTGMTLEDFLFKEKMTRAAFMLVAYREISVKEVAERIGFCTCDYFIRKFRHYFGMVPGKYKAYKAPRSGIRERRSELKDRRQEALESNIPNTGERRKGQKDRRNGRTDRRKQNDHYQNSDPLGDQDREVENPGVIFFSGQGQGRENGKGNSCKTCAYRSFALNFDDGK
jgi:AraC-like DNA-binding protein